MDYDSAWLSPYISGDDSVLWLGRPENIRLFEASDIFTIPFSLLWCGFAVFWEWVVWRSGALLFFRLWGIPFVLVGLYLVIGRFIHRLYLLKHTHYAITTTKLIRNQNGKIDVLHKNALPEMRVSTRADGSGSVHFLSATAYRGPSVQNSLFSTRGFSIECVPNIDYVVKSISNNPI